MVREATYRDVKAIVDIYNYYVLNHIATFAEQLVDENEMKQNLKNAIHWLVYEESSKILGYAYASPWKKRSAYKNSVETSVYIKNNEGGKGIGTQLYKVLLDYLKLKKYHTAIGGISLPNQASESLHEKLGYKKIAHFKEVGFKFNQWIDVGYWQLTL